MKKTVIFSLALLAFSLNIAKAQTRWESDQVHSNAIFTVTHLVVSEVSGHFKEFSASMVSTKDDFSDSKVEATIKVASISTDNEKRDGHLKSEDFFYAEKYPEIKFISKSFTKTGDKTYKITGDLTMRGVTKTIELNAIYKGSVKDPWGNTKTGWTATGSLNRFDYGLNWNSLIEAGGAVVGETVNLQLNIAFVQKK
ncbi:YceI family protein [bacterium]|nr:YceI family protein [bacterium]